MDRESAGEFKTRLTCGLRRMLTEGGPEIELIGDLASMVHLGQEPDGAGPVRGAVREEFARSVKVVAGAGFEPATFRL